MIFPSNVPSALHDLHGLLHLFPEIKFFLNSVSVFPVHILKIVSCIIFPLKLFFANLEGTNIHFHSNQLKIDMSDNNKFYIFLLPLEYPS